MTVEREHPRYAHEAAVTFHTGSRTVIGRTRNLSRGGLCADLAEPIPAGRDLDIDLALVFEDEAQSEPLRVPARIAWCTPVDEAHQVGVMFRPMPADIAEYLTMFLRFLDEGKPPKKSKRAEIDIDDRFK